MWFLVAVNDFNGYGFEVLCAFPKVMQDFGVSGVYVLNAFPSTSACLRCLWVWCRGRGPGFPKPIVAGFVSDPLLIPYCPELIFGPGARIPVSGAPAAFVFNCF